MPSSSYPNSNGISPDKLLPALHHAISGSAGTLISTCTLYPLSLVITRLQVQRQLRREGRLNQYDPDGTTTSHHGQEEATGLAQEPTSGGIAEAFSAIWNSGGGLKAFYTGLAQDAAKSVLDSFLFFLFYEWFRSARLFSRARARGGKASLGVLEEVAVGMAASACSKFFTTPFSNIVTRKQAASLMDDDRDLSTRQIINAIRQEQGILGLWSGYSASLVLTLNPGITFYLQGFLKTKTVSAEKWDNPGARMTFLLAAMSKVIASTITYPFQTAQTRMQAGIPPVRSRKGSRSGGHRVEEEQASEAGGYGEPEPLIEIPPEEMPPSDPTSHRNNVAPPERVLDRDAGYNLNPFRAVKNLGKNSIFGTVAYMAKNEGVGSLYDGIQGELLRGFLGHGTTMLAKDVVHKLLFKLYIMLASMLVEVRARRARGRSSDTPSEANASAGSWMGRLGKMARRQPRKGATTTTTTTVTEETFIVPSAEAARSLMEESATRSIEAVPVSMPTPTAAPSLPAPVTSSAPAIAPTPVQAPAPVPVSAHTPRSTPMPEPMSMPAPTPTPASAFTPRATPTVPSSALALARVQSASTSAPPPPPASALVPASAPLSTLVSAPIPSSIVPAPSAATPYSSTPRYTPPAFSSSSSRMPARDSAPAYASSPSYPSSSPSNNYTSSSAPAASSSPAPRRRALRALQYRMDNAPSYEYEQIPQSLLPALAHHRGIGGSGRRERRSSLSASTQQKVEDFVVNVVANMIDGTQRGLK